MNNESRLAPTICEDCETVFYGGVNAYLCPHCRRKRIAEAAKERNLSALGHEARRKKKEGEAG